MMSDEDYLFAVGACFWASPKMGVKLKAAIEKHASYVGKHRHRYFDAYPAIMSYVLWLRDHALVAETEEGCSKIISDHLGGIKPLAAKPAGEWQMAPYFGWLADFRPEVAKRLLKDFKPAAKSAPPVPEFRQVPPRQRFADWIEVLNHRSPHLAKALSMAEPANSNLQPTLHWPDLDQLDRARLAWLVRDVASKLIVAPKFLTVSISSLAILMLGALSLIAGSQWLDERRISSLRADLTTEAILDSADLWPSTQIELLQERLKDARSDAEEADVLTALSIVHGMMRDEIALTYAEDAVRLRDGDVTMLERLAIFQASFAAEAGLTQTLDRIAALRRPGNDADRFLNVAWIFQIDGWRQLAAAAGDAEAVWQTIGRLDDETTRELVMMVAATKYALVLNDYSLVENYLEHSTRRRGRPNKLFEFSRLGLEAEFAVSQRRYDDAIGMMAQAASEAWGASEIKMFAILELARARYLYRRNRSEPAEAIAVLESILDDMRTLGDKQLLFETLGSLFFFHRDWPNFDIQSALPYAREAYALGGNDPANELFSRSEFLELYAGEERSSGDPSVAAEIYAHLLTLKPSDTALRKMDVALLMRDYASALHESGAVELAEEEGRKAIRMGEQAIAAIPPAEPITVDAHPRTREVDRVRVGLLDMLSGSGLYNFTNDILVAQLDELASLPPSLREHYADYERQLRLHQLQNGLDSYRDVPNAIRDIDTFVLETTALLDDTSRGIQASKYSNLTAALYDKAELDFTELFGESGEYVSRIRDAWQTRVDAIFKESGATGDNSLGGIPHIEDIAAQGVAIAPAEWLSEISPGRTEEIESLVEFVGQYTRAMIHLPDTRMRELAAFLSLAYAPRAEGDEIERARYFDSAWLYASVAATLGDGAERHSSYVEVASQIADLWLAGVAQSRSTNTPMHSEMLAYSISGATLRGEFERALALVQQFEDASLAQYGACTSCDAMRAAILERYQVSLD